VGAYSPAERRRRIERFLEKRRLRVWQKNVKYDVRKNFADSRIRVKGRFVKKEDQLAMMALGVSPTDRTSSGNSDCDSEKSWSGREREREDSLSREICVSELEGEAMGEGQGQGLIMGVIVDGKSSQTVVKSSLPYLVPGRSRTRGNSDLQRKDSRGLGRMDNISTST
jgi:CCT motif